MGGHTHKCTATGRTCQVWGNFCRGDSTSLQLTRIVQELYTQRHQRRHQGLCFFDLAKAFDSVWHRGLIAKLRSCYRVTHRTNNWLSSYLSMRTQAVKAGGLISEDRPVNAGVPQGSILGPLLFLMYVNDLPSVTPGLSLYADDTALHRSASTEHELTVSLQQGIKEVVNWMKIWKLQPNV